MFCAHGSVVPEIRRQVREHGDARVEKLMSRQGLMSATAVEAERNNQPFLAELYGASVSGRVLSGARAGQQTTRMGDIESGHGYEETPSPRCVNVNGIGLHANTVIPARDRMRLERMLRYMCRPPIAIERLKLLSDERTQPNHPMADKRPAAAALPIR